MDITCYKLENDTIKKVGNEIKVEEWNDNVDWIDIRSENRKEAADYFKEQNLYDENVRACIEHPEQFPFSNTFDKKVILNLSVSSAADIYKTEYITIIIDYKLIIVVSPKANDIFNERYLSVYSEKKFASLSNFLFYVLAVKTISQSNANMSMARNRLQEIDFMLENNPEKLSSKDLMSCERDISKLSDIIEDQYVGFGILASLSSALMRITIFRKQAK